MVPDWTRKKYRKGFEPMLEDVTFVGRNNVEALRAELSMPNTCAIVLEPIFGEGGSLECSARLPARLPDARHTAPGGAHLRRDHSAASAALARSSPSRLWSGSRHVTYRQADRAGVPLGAFLSKEAFRLRRFRRDKHAPPLAAVHWRRRVGLKYLAIVEKNTCSKMCRESLAATCINSSGLVISNAASPQKRAAAVSFKASVLEIPRAPLVEQGLAEACSLQRDPGATAPSVLPPFLPQEKPGGIKRQSKN